VGALEYPAVVRAALDACARTVTGSPAAATTARRKRAVFHNALEHAVELGLLPANPMDRISWTAPEVAQTVDRRVVASPAQAAALLAGVRAQGERGQHLEASSAACTTPRPPSKRSPPGGRLLPARRRVGADRPGRLAPRPGRA
jgi:hypothetical protein